jgi:hypothetical protein
VCAAVCLYRLGTQSSSRHLWEVEAGACVSCATVSSCSSSGGTWLLLNKLQRAFIAGLSAAAAATAMGCQQQQWGASNNSSGGGSSSTWSHGHSSAECSMLASRWQVQLVQPCGLWVCWACSCYTSNQGSGLQCVRKQSGMRQWIATCLQSAVHEPVRWYCPLLRLLAISGVAPALSQCLCSCSVFVTPVACRHCCCCCCTQTLR